MREDLAFRLAGRDFTWWSELAKDDPECFERMRRAAIDEVIDSAPDYQRMRLRGLQWRIDQERRRSANPIASCVRISNMMWDALMGPDGLMDRMRELTAEELLARGKVARPGAKVLPFRHPE